MKAEDPRYRTYIQILQEELIPAMGCTEPIAIAYGAAKAREVLGCRPEQVMIGVSNNILKNVKSAVIPNTDGLYGIPAAAAAGIAGGKPEKKLEVIAEMTAGQKAELRQMLSSVPFSVTVLDSGEVFDIVISLKAGEESACVRISGFHTNIVSVMKNGEEMLKVNIKAAREAKPEDNQKKVPETGIETVLEEQSGSRENEHKASEAGYETAAEADPWETVNPRAASTQEAAPVLHPCEAAGLSGEHLTDRAFLNIRDILDFAMTVDIEDVRALLDRQIQCNTAIAEEGLSGSYGANVGATYLRFYGTDVRNRAIARAAAGSDARMNGCEMPVVINSGSGNQGITVSVPVIEYARELAVSDEKLYRALTLSNLIAIHLKTGIGRLSAYCGAVSAGCAAGCGIAYLQGGDYEAICHTLVNALAIVSGIICDGAKSSCAAKIASSVEAGLLGYHMYLNGQEFKDGEGIVKKGVENTIRSIGRLGRDGMRETDREIVKIMLS